MYAPTDLSAHLADPPRPPSGGVRRQMFACLCLQLCEKGRKMAVFADFFVETARAIVVE